MTVTLRRQFQELLESVPSYPQHGKDQLWRNVATELSYRRAQAEARRSGRFRGLWLAGVVALALLLVVLPPFVNQSPNSVGGYLMRTQLLEAAPRPERSVVSWRDGLGAGEAGFHVIAANPRLELLLNDDGMRFMLRHKPTGQTWATSPDVRDARVSLAQFSRLSSPFAIRYGDEAGRVDGWANPVDDVAYMEYYPVSNGVGIRFVFENLGIAVRVDYQLGDGFFEVRIPEGGIEEYGAYRVKAVELLPFFDAVAADEQKRLVMAAAGERADGLPLPTAPADAPEQRLLFGVVGETTGFLAEVVEGVESATIHVDASGMAVDAQRVYVEFLVTPRADGRTGGRSGTPSYAVRYYTLTQENAALDGAAGMFQRHMREGLGGGRRMVDGQTALTDVV